MKKLMGLQLRVCIALTCTIAASCFAQNYQELTLSSADGSMLKALLIHPQTIPEGQLRPAIVALHGCGGLYATLGPRQGQPNARHDGMARLLNQQGYSVLFPDSFSTRGQASICTQKIRDRQIRQAQRRDDVTGALTWLANQPWVDAEKMAVIGWSHGGSAVLAAVDANDPMVSARPVQPSLAIAFYPGCSEALRSHYRPIAPLHLLLAELDDWTPAAPCIELARRVNAQVELFPDSHHDFDSPVGAVKHRPEVPNGANPGKGVHAGRNPVTGPQAWQRVVDYLANAWRR
jgi:dienelactone hydrolase